MLLASPAHFQVHVARAITQILVEIRQTRQLVQFVHGLLAEESVARHEGLIPTPESIEREAAKARARVKGTEITDRITRVLARRREKGLGDELTLEEQQAFARGEVPASFQDPGGE